MAYKDRKDPEPMMVVRKTVLNVWLPLTL